MYKVVGILFRAFFSCFNCDIYASIELMSLSCAFFYFEQLLLFRKTSLFLNAITACQLSQNSNTAIKINF